MDRNEICEQLNLVLKENGIGDHLPQSIMKDKSGGLDDHWEYILWWCWPLNVYNLHEIFLKAML